MRRVSIQLASVAGGFRQKMVCGYVACKPFCFIVSFVLICAMWFCLDVGDHLLSPSDVSENDDYDK